MRLQYSTGANEDKNFKDGEENVPGCKPIKRHQITPFTVIFITTFAITFINATVILIMAQTVVKKTDQARIYWLRVEKNVIRKEAYVYVRVYVRMLVCVFPRHVYV